MFSLQMYSLIFLHYRYFFKSAQLVAHPVGRHMLEEFGITLPEKEDL